MKKPPSIPFPRELFMECMDAIEKQYEHDRKCSDAFQIILPQDFITSYDNHWLANQLVKLMQVALNDDHEHSWIEYFIWEINFGKDYTKWCAKRKDGSNIDLSSAAKLWDFLNEEEI